MKVSEAMFELAKLLENKYPDFKYKKSQKYLEKKTKKYIFLFLLKYKGKCRFRCLFYCKQYRKCFSSFLQISLERVNLL